ncbi:hypothetical protein L227DRAFT_576287 [Lentinus tigrinus ALCF2SS1-6]|uniref:Uncharacterized protein n=1 Tax=Lentinus tigrinus ALCF2SS1-6 TaxID=1328759 RepID=A0A5C2S8J1_9APHY|nr:hypothetical protein L227DRAFT_576287 [Lentinus tigrinus ALCF2SS1-6]
MSTSATDIKGPKAPCRFFRARHIPYTYWYEYALRYHGSKTVLSYLYLLVDSVQDAASCLRSQGWTDATLPWSAFQSYDPAVDEQIILGCGESEVFKVVLLSSHTWPGITPPADDNDEVHYPSLPQLYNALAQRFLDTDDEEFRRYLNLQIEYLYEDSAALASPAFVTMLPPDIQQLHIDWQLRVLCMPISETIQHEREIRSRARRGEWSLMREGTAELGGGKIDYEYEAQMVARIEAKDAPRMAAIYGPDWKSLPSWDNMVREEWEVEEKPKEEGAGERKVQDG